ALAPCHLCAFRLIEIGTQRADATPQLLLFQLGHGVTTTTSAAAARLPCQKALVVAHPWRFVVETSQLDLELCHARACSPLKDAENDLGTVDHLHVESTPEGALLRGAELAIEHDPPRRSAACRI